MEQKRKKEEPKQKKERKKYVDDFISFSSLLYNIKGSFEFHLKHVDELTNKLNFIDDKNKIISAKNDIQKAIKKLDDFYEYIIKTNNIPLKRKMKMFK